MVHNDRSDEACLIYVTFDREYLFEGRTCVRSRSRTTGIWEHGSPTRLLGVLRRGELDPALVARDERPRTGDRLCMSIRGERVLSSPVVAVERAAWASLELQQESDGTLSLGVLVVQPPPRQRRRSDKRKRRCDSEPKHHASPGAA